MKKRQKRQSNHITLNPTNITNPALDDFDLGWSGNPRPSMPPAFQFGSFMTNALREWSELFDKLFVQVEPDVIAELATLRGDTAEDKTTVAGLLQELSIRDALTAKKTAEAAEASTVADRFYGMDPLSISVDQQMKTVVALMQSDQDLGSIHDFAQKSHEAAYKRRFALHALTLLTEQSNVLRVQLAQLQAQEAAAAEQAEAQRLEQERQQQISAANTFKALGESSSTGAHILGVAGVIAVSDGGVLSLQAAIRAAISALAQLAAGTVSGMFVGVSALVYTPKLGNGELPPRFAVTLPLSELSPIPAEDLRAVAASGGTADLPVRLGSRVVGEEDHSQVIAIQADGVSIPNKVRVLAATFNTEQHVYSVTTADTPPRTLTWTPVVPPIDASTTLPVEVPPAPVYEGATVTPVEARLDVYPEAADSGFDDYVLVFPVDSGMQPLYLVFKSPRDMPGVASGDEPPASGRWMDAASINGAPIPGQVVDVLRGREFSNFSAFRKAFWKAVSVEPELTANLSAANIEAVRKGSAPISASVEFVGKRRQYEIHHVIFLSQGGGVYDMSNMRILSPRKHISLHSKKE